MPAGGFTGDGWELLTDAVDQHAAELAESRWTRYAAGTISARLPTGGRALLKKAAHARQMGMHAYVGRAVMAFVCADLGLDWYEVMEDEYPIVILGDPPRSRRPYGGAGFGNWQITP